jgi:L-Ala-D/L-Glu epimerase
VAQGFTTLKLKLTADAVADLTLATAVRTAVGDSIHLRGDANQTWTIAETPRRLRALAHLNWQFIEEPCIDTYKLVPMDLPIALALDESLPHIAPSQIAQLLRSRSLWGVVLKPTVLGNGRAGCTRWQTSRGHACARRPGGNCCVCRSRACDRVVVRTTGRGGTG